MVLKEYLLDTLAVIVFWTPIALVNALIIGMTWYQIGAMIIAIGITDLMFGGLYGRFINRWRDKLNYV